VTIGENVNGLFPGKYKEKVLQLNHLHGLLATREVCVTKVDWKDSQLLRQMPKDIDLLLEEGDINHLNNILLDDKNDFKFFHQLGILHLYLQVALEGSDGAHIYLRIPRVENQYSFE
jgi:hypothetical protein